MLTQLGEWLRDHLEPLGFAITVIGLLLAVVFFLVRVPRRRPITPGSLLGVAASIAITVIGIVLLIYPPPPPPPPSTSPTPTISSHVPVLGPTVYEPCRWQTAPVQWDNDGLGQNAVPESGHEFEVNIEACSTALLDGTRFLLEDGTSCDGLGVSLCVVVWQSSSSSSTVVRNLDERSNFVGHTPSSYQYAINDKETLWWKIPNCTKGCVGAYITIYVGGQRIQTNTFVGAEP